MFFDEHEEDNHRNSRQEGRGKKVIPLDHRESRKLSQANREGKVDIAVDDDGGNGVFIPGVDENEDQCRDDAGSSHGKEYPDKSGDRIAAVNAGSLLHLRRDGNKSTPEKPDCESLVERGINEDQAGERIIEFQINQQPGDADQENNRGEHLAHDHETEESLTSAETHARQCVCGRNAAEEGQACGSDREKEGVQEITYNSAPQDMREVFPPPVNGKEVEKIDIICFRIRSEGAGAMMTKG